MNDPKTATTGCRARSSFLLVLVLHVIYQDCGPEITVSNARNTQALFSWFFSIFFFSICHASCSAWSNEKINSMEKNVKQFAVVVVVVVVVVKLSIIVFLYQMGWYYLRNTKWRANTRDRTSTFEFSQIFSSVCISLCKKVRAFYIDKICNDIRHTRVNMAWCKTTARPIRARVIWLQFYKVKHNLSNTLVKYASNYSIYLVVFQFRGFCAYMLSQDQL